MTRTFASVVSEDVSISEHFTDVVVRDKVVVELLNVILAEVSVVNFTSSKWVLDNIFDIVAVLF